MWLESLLNRLKKLGVKTVLLLILTLFVVPIILVHILFKIPAGIPFLEAEWDAGDIVSYLITFMSFLGTLFLGILALVQNNKLNEINKDLTQYQFKPVISINPFFGEIDEREVLRTYDRNVGMDVNGNIINHGWSLHQPHFSKTLGINIKNIGLGPAVNIELFWHQLDSVKGLSDLNQIKEKNIEDFYDKVKYSNFSFVENEQIKNELWQIFKDFELGISEETNGINLLFSFESNVSEIHTIIEVRYKNILERKTKKLIYLGYHPTEGLSILPVSKDYTYN